MKILVTGRQGQLGSELQDISNNFPQYEWIFVGREELDLSNSKQILEVLNQHNPEIIINAAAYTAVDKAETEQELSDAVNHLALKIIGTWAAKHHAKVIHISTDYVFSGNSEKALEETDAVDPINVYGWTKRKGEEALMCSGAQYIIIRTAWVYSIYGANFVKTMIRLMSDREEISVVSDQIGTPTYALDLAGVIVNIIQAPDFIDGIYHYSNEGSISWYDFAMEIKKQRGLECKINAIPTESFPTPARRPKYSLLNKSKIKSTFAIEIPFWKQSLTEMLTKLK